MLFLIPLMLFWINMHGGFVVGYFLLGIYLAGNIIQTVFSAKAERHTYKKKAKAIAFIILGFLCISLINPYGYHLILFPLKFLRQTFIIDHVTEFMSLSFHSIAAKPYEFFLLITISVISLSKNRLNIIEIMLFVIFLHMALFSGRYILLFVIIVTPILTKNIKQLIESSSGKLSKFFIKKGEDFSEIDKHSSGFIWILMAVVMVSILAANGKASHSFDVRKTPLAAIEFIMKEKIPGNMMNDSEFGDYLIYGAYPEYKVFIDSRFDMYGEDSFKEYLNIMNFEPGWEKIINRYDINWMILPIESGFSRFLSQHEDWKIIYKDKIATIFIKNKIGNQALIKKYQQKKDSFRQPETG